MSMVPWNELFEAAWKARSRAHAPYSKFLVGAALWCDDGSIVSGCNVENASYGLTVCAERNALGAMVLAGRTLRAVAIVTEPPSGEATSPCGACRQVLNEFAKADLPIRSRTRSLEAQWTLGQLLPHAFSKV